MQSTGDVITVKHQPTIVQTAKKHYYLGDIPTWSVPILYYNEISPPHSPLSCTGLLSLSSVWTCRCVNVHQYYLDIHLVIICHIHTDVMSM